MFREAVEVQAVVPVGPADERQTVGAEMGTGIAEAAAQMLQQRLGKAGIVVKIHLLVQNAPVPGLAEIGVRSGDEPEGIVVKAAADGEIAFLREGLVLVIGAAVRKLGGGDVQDALARALRDHVQESRKPIPRPMPLS